MPVSDVEPIDTDSPPTGAPPDRLIVEMVALAEAERISPTQLARACGINQGYWSRARRGIERLGPSVIARVVEQHPQLHDAAVQYLAEGGRLPPSAAIRLMEEAAQHRCGAPDPSGP
jgi:hypothetical protein